MISTQDAITMGGRYCQRDRSTSFMIIFDFLHENYEERWKRRFTALKEGVMNPGRTMNEYVMT